MSNHSDDVFLQPAACRHPMCAVYLDDDPAQRMALIMLTETWGCQTWAGATPQDVLPHVRAAAHIPDIIVTDFQLGAGLADYEAVAQCNEALNCAPPVIVVTGDNSPELRENVIRCGWHILHKPFQPHVLQALMAEIAVAMAN